MKQEQQKSESRYDEVNLYNKQNRKSNLLGNPFGYYFHKDF